MKKELGLASIERQKKKALDYSIKEGSSGSFSVGISNAYITPFALKLSQNEIFVGVLSALTGLVAPISQIFGSILMKRYSRKSIVLKAIFWQVLLWLPLSILAILKYFNLFQDTLIYIFVLFYTLIVAFAGVLYPSWFSWIGDLVKDKHKGRFFAKRNTVMGVYELISVVAGGVILKITENTSVALLSFAAIFFLSGFFRLISLNYMRKMYIDESAKLIRSHKSTFSNIMKHKEFKIFTWYNLSLNFAIFFASPFFAVYMLKELQFSYLTYMTVALSGGVYYLIFNKAIGRFSDKFGNTHLLIIAGICFALNPLLWMISKSPLYLILIPGIVTGIANSAFILAVNSFSLDALSLKERGQGISLVSLFSGIGIFIGSLLGGAMLKIDLNLFSLGNFLTLFLVGFALRAIVTLIFLPHIKEVRKVKELPHAHISLIHPFKSINAEILWVKHIFK